MITVLYFAACRERTGHSQEALDLGGRSVDELVAALVERHPRLGEITSHCRVAVDHAFKSGQDRVPDGAEVALIPPVAGG